MLASDNPAELVSIPLRLNQILRLFLVVAALLIDVMSIPTAWAGLANGGYLVAGAARTIVINTMERKLFFVLGEGRAIRYPIDSGNWAAPPPITQRI